MGSKILFCTDVVADNNQLRDVMVYITRAKNFAGERVTHLRTFANFCDLILFCRIKDTIHQRWNGM